MRQRRKKKECSIFIFEKRCAEKLHKPKRKETVTEILRNSIKQLERFRHPKVLQHLSHYQSCLDEIACGDGLNWYWKLHWLLQILQIIHPVEECSETLAFATEPVFASLANILAYQVSETKHMPAKRSERHFRDRITERREKKGFVSREPIWNDVIWICLYRNHVAL